MKTSKSNVKRLFIMMAVGLLVPALLLSCGDSEPSSNSSSSNSSSSSSSSSLNPTNLPEGTLSKRNDASVEGFVSVNGQRLSPTWAMAVWTDTLDQRKNLSIGFGERQPRGDYMFNHFLMEQNRLPGTFSRNQAKGTYADVDLYFKPDVERIQKNLKPRTNKLHVNNFINEVSPASVRLKMDDIKNLTGEIKPGGRILGTIKGSGTTQAQDQNGKNVELNVKWDLTFSLPIIQTDKEN